MVQVAKWLESLGLGQHAKQFAESDIDFEVLSELTEVDLEKLGLSLGHRKKLLRAIRDLGEQPSVARIASHASSRPLTPADQASSDAERRQLTVMFADFVGSTELSQELDPEDYRAVIKSFQEVCTAVVRRYEGYVAKYLGDGVLAYFGYPQAHEDDAERAVRAGLGMMKTMEASVRRGDTKQQARVGIATGLVVVGDVIGEGVSEKSAVSGETPNLAARLQSAAEPGNVVVSENTRRLLGEMFAFEALENLELKGVAGKTRAWRVAGELATEDRFEAIHSGRLTRFVGRDSEMNLLWDRWQQAKDGEGQVILLSGEAGIGKSRIAAEFRGRLSGEEHIRMRWQCSPHNTGSAFYAAIRHLEAASRIDVTDPPVRKLEKLEKLLAQAVDDVERVAPLFADLLSIPVEGRYPRLDQTPERQREMTIEAVVEQFEALATQNPVFFVLEDAHWIDPSTRELLDRFVDRVRKAQALIMVTARPEFAWPWLGHAHVTTFPLNRLSRRNCEQMIETLGRDRDLPVAARDHIITKADGVPLFVEELTAGALEADIGSQAQLSSSMAIPSTLQDSLMARLDRLGAAKEMAQLAAVLGREFSQDLIAAVAPMSGTNLEGTLNQLVDAGLLVRRAAAPAASFVFKHTLLQDAAYGSLLKSKRQEYHRATTKALEERFSGLAETQPELLAHHFQEAGLIEQAVGYWLKAGRRAAQQSSYQEATAHLETGLERLATLPDTADRARTELSFQIALGSVLGATKTYSAAETGNAYDRARELAEVVGSGDDVHRALSGVYINKFTLGEHHGAKAIADELLSHAECTKDASLIGPAELFLAASLLYLGAPSEAQSHFDRADSMYDYDKHHERAIRSSFGFDWGFASAGYHGLGLWLLGYPDQAAQEIDRTSPLLAQTTHTYTKLRANNWFSMVALLRRDWTTVRERSGAAIEGGDEHGFALVRAAARVMHGAAISAGGEVEEGLREIRRGIDACRAASVLFQYGFLSAIIAETLLRAGRSADGREAINDALQLIETTEERFFEAELHRLKGELLLALQEDRAVETEGCFDRALEVSRSQAAKSLELRVATSLSRLWRDQGKTNEARDLLAPIYNWFTEGFDTADLKDAKALLEKLK